MMNPEGAMRQAGMTAMEYKDKAMKYAIVIEKASDNYGAYVPDLPGCVATGETVEETLQQIQEAIEFHLEGMLLHGETIPEPSFFVPIH